MFVHYQDIKAIMSSMKRNVFAFIGLNWSVHRVILGIEKHLHTRFEFKYLDSAGYYTVSDFMELYSWCDIVLTNLETIRTLKGCFPSINFKKVFFVSHGAIENEVVNDYDAESTYGMTSECLKPFFPPNLSLYVTPNGIDPSIFKYRRRDGTLKTLGWGGCPNIPSKRVEWAYTIAKAANLPLRIGYGMGFHDIIDWYDTVDLLLITAGPDIHSETGPLPAFEAILSGVPVIGTFVGNFSKIPGPKFFNMDDAFCMIQFLKNNPNIMTQIADEQYDYVMNNFTYEVLYPLWEIALDNVITRSKETNNA